MQIAWANALIIMALSVGHAALVVAIVNRLHSLPLSDRTLHRFRQLHDVLLPGLPLLFLWYAGWRGPRLLLGGSWHLLPLSVLAYLAICGTVFLALPIVAWRRRGRTRLQLSNHSQHCDISRRLGMRPIGDGPYQFMARLPGNEAFQLEVSDKEYRVPRLPEEWDGLSILHLSDLHYIGTVGRRYFDELFEMARTLPADLIVLTGDALDRQDLINWLPATLGRLSAPLGCWYVLGNHDSYLPDVEALRRELSRLGWQGLAGRCESVWHRGRELVLCGSERPWMGRQPELRLAPDEAFRLLLSHTPDNLEWARRHHIDLMLAGHNHGGQVRLPGFGPVYSPSIYGAKYASGAFWESPTLLYVSRGIGGRHPLRWNCLPELTRLILRPAPVGLGLDRIAREAAPAGRTNQLRESLA
ncbi:MAG: metallophosphoesterase [Planctomycetaceae bacterium]